MLLLLVTRCGVGAGAGTLEGVASAVVDFFLRFFLPSPLPMMRKVVLLIAAVAVDKLSLDKPSLLASAYLDRVMTKDSEGAKALVWSWTGDLDES